MILPKKKKKNPSLYEQAMKWLYVGFGLLQKELAPKKKYPTQARERKKNQKRTRNRKKKKKGKKGCGEKKKVVWYVCMYVCPPPRMRRPFVLGIGLDLI